jgi:hypothetical protein
VNTTNWVTVVAFELLSMTIVGYTPAPRPAGLAVSVKVAGVVPLVGATVSHAALLKLAVKGTAATGLLVTAKVC